MGILSQMISAIQSGDIKTFMISLCISLLALLPALILHECAHGRVALWCGDDTAKLSGRLSLNPAAHLDLWGTLCMFLIGFGWAKPVPVNPWNFKNRRRDSIFVSLAGIITNLLLFILSTILCVVIAMIIVKPVTDANSALYTFNNMTRAQVIRDYANGYYYTNEAIVQAGWLRWFILYFRVLASYNITLAVFNFLPIPPLDGYRFWNAAVFNNKLQVNQNVVFMIMIVIFILNRTTGVLDTVLSSVTGFFTETASSAVFAMFGV